MKVDAEKFDIAQFFTTLQNFERKTVIEEKFIHFCSLELSIFTKRFLHSVNNYVSLEKMFTNKSIINPILYEYSRKKKV